MRVVIPSNPDQYVDLRQPTFGDLRKIQDLSENVIIKNALVRLCTDSKIDKFTTLDRDYLFFLCCSSIHKGVLSPKIQCSCGKSSSFKVPFSDFDVFYNNPNSKTEITYFVGWRLFKFRILTVEEEEWCVRKAMSWEGYSEDLLRDILTAKVIRNRKFDYSNEEEFYKTFKKLPMRAMLIAQNFEKLCFHGILPLFEVKCPECGKDLEVPFPIKGDLCQVPSESITKAFSALAEIITFDDFLKFSIPEYETFVKSLKDGKER